MKHLKKCKGLLLSVLGATALLVAAGCVYESRPAPPPPPPPAADVGYDYYYYPDQEVYFYPATGVYFWVGGGVWHSGPRLPSTIVIRPEARVSVRLNTRVPYERHEEIRARYPAHRPPVERRE